MESTGVHPRCPWRSRGRRRSEGVYRAGRSLTLESETERNGAERWRRVSVRRTRRWRPREGRRSRRFTGVHGGRGAGRRRALRPRCRTGRSETSGTVEAFRGLPGVTGRDAGRVSFERFEHGYRLRDSGLSCPTPTRGFRRFRQSERGSGRFPGSPPYPLSAVVVADQALHDHAGAADAGVSAVARATVRSTSVAVGVALGSELVERERAPTC